jgi:hypothetical protein
MARYRLHCNGGSGHSCKATALRTDAGRHMAAGADGAETVRWARREGAPLPACGLDRFGLAHGSAATLQAMQ